MIGAVLNMIGDCLLWGANSVGAVGAFGQYILAAQKVSYTRIGLADFFGYVGIPVSIFGYYVLYEIMEDKTSLLTGMKKAPKTDTAPNDNILTVILQEQGGYIVPCFVVFFLFYFINVVTMVLIIAKKRTCLPGWMWIINPLLFKILFNGLGKMSTSAVLNGIACSQFRNQIIGLKDYADFLSAVFHQLLASQFCNIHVIHYDGSFVQAVQSAQHI